MKRAALIGLLLLSLALNVYQYSNPVTRILLIPYPTPAPCVKFDPLNPQAKSQRITWDFSERP